MSRLARMMGLGGAAALGAGLLLATPALAAETPDATLTIPGLGGFGDGILCTTNEANHEISLRVTLADDVDAPTTISNVNILVNGTALATQPTFPQIDAGATQSNTTALATPNQIDSVSGTVTVTSGDGGQPRTVTLSGAEDVDAAACSGGGATTSTTVASSTSTTTGGSTTSTTGGSTTSTTGGSTTSTTGGSTTSTSSTSTTLGPNDTVNTLTVSPSTVAPGGSITVAGTGFAPNVDVTITLFSDPVVLGTLKSNAAGAISGSVAIPATTPTGAHKVEAKGSNVAGNGINLLRADLTVRANTGSIPRTGGSSDFLLPVGIAVVSLGILAFAWRERRIGLR